MSVSLSPKLHRYTEKERGLTLLEVLTVLFIIGIAAGLAAPNFPVLLDRVIHANQRDTVIQAINAIPFKALESGQDYVLQDAAAAEEDARIGLAPGGPERFAIRAVGATNIQLPLPDGWTIAVARPIIYKASGFCSGGTLEIDTGTVSTPYTLTAPLCQIRQ